MQVKMNLITAKDFLIFVEIAISQHEENNNIPLSDDKKEKFEEELYGIRDFTKIAVQSELDPIIVPERYNRIYMALEQMLKVLMVDGFLNEIGKFLNKGEHDA